jgi:hypothetical protein
MGAIVHDIMTRQKPDWSRGSTSTIMARIGCLPGWQPNTLSIDHLCYKKSYWKELRSVVKKCINIEPLRRPSALDLLNQVATGLEGAMQVAQDNGTLSDSLPIELNAPMVAIYRPEQPSHYLP